MTAKTTASFGSTATERKSTFECSLDNAVFVPCKKTVTYKNLTPGTHTFQAKATDPAGNTDPMPADWTWTIT